MATETESQRATSAAMADTPVGDTAAPAPKPKAGGLRALWSRPASKRIAGLLGLVVVIVGAWFFLHDDGGSGAGDCQIAKAVAGHRTLTDATAGYQVTYPGSWTEFHCGAAKPADTVGLHHIRINDSDAFTIRTFALEQKENPKNLSDMRAVTDAILSTPQAHLTVVDVREVKVAGLPAVRYIYYFPYGKQRGVHAHYFVFDGNIVHTIVFQVVPAEKFENYAHQFDQVLASFKPLTR